MDHDDNVLTSAIKVFCLYVPTTTSKILAYDQQNQTNLYDVQYQAEVSPSTYTYTSNRSEVKIESSVIFSVFHQNMIFLP